MQEQNDKLTPEKQAEISRLSTYFGIRPDATFTDSLHVFDSMPEAERPSFTFRFMGSSMKEEYEDKMQKFMDRIEREHPAPKDESPEDRTERIARALQSNRAERNAMMYPFVRKCLQAVHRLPYADQAGTLEWDATSAEREMPERLWDSLSYALRPLLADLLFKRSFMSETEATAVKS